MLFTHLDVKCTGWFVIDNPLWSELWPCTQITSILDETKMPSNNIFTFQPVEEISTMWSFLLINYYYLTSPSILGLIYLARKFVVKFYLELMFKNYAHIWITLSVRRKWNGSNDNPKMSVENTNINVISRIGYTL